MRGYWIYKTKRRTFSIRLRDDGRFVAFCDDEALGSYHSAPQALEDLVNGSSFWPSSGDPSKAGLPDDLSDWTFVRF